MESLQIARKELKHLNNIANHGFVREALDKLASNRVHLSDGSTMTAVVNSENPSSKDLLTDASVDAFNKVGIVNINDYLNTIYSSNITYNNIAYHLISQIENLQRQGYKYVKFDLTPSRKITNIRQVVATDFKPLTKAMKKELKFEVTAF